MKRNRVWPEGREILMLSLQAHQISGISDPHIAIRDLLKQPNAERPDAPRRGEGRPRLRPAPGDPAIARLVNERLAPTAS